MTILSNLNGHANGDAKDQTNADGAHESPVTRTIKNLFACEGTVVISGGDGCIGLAMVDALAEAGADIISLQLDNNTRAVQTAARHGRSCHVYLCDQRDPSSVEAAFPKILADGLDPSIFVSWYVSTQSWSFHTRNS